MTYRTTTALVAALAARHVSAVELVDQAIARIEALDGHVTAVVVRDFDRARAAAAAADQALDGGERRPLLGVPMTVKEAYNVAGLPTTWGMPLCKDWRPAEDAVAVARVKAAGAVILGKTNVPFALADWQSYNDIYGTTNNPWDLDRTLGGSSGGSAAALAMGYAALELESDLGGSLRAPAHYCGVYAHKPTHALVPSRGHTPPGVPPLPQEVDLAVVGPMARSADDLALALAVLAGPDEPDAVAYRLALPAARHDTLQEFRVLVIDTHPLLPTAHAVRAALARLSERLAQAGCTLAQSSSLLPDLAAMARLYMQLLFSFLAADWPPDLYRRVTQAAAALLPGDDSLVAWRRRGMALSHRDMENQHITVGQAWIAIMPLGAKRCMWTTHFPMWLGGAGGGALVLSAYFILRALADNSFASPLIRIQTERQYTVVSTGVYGFVRYPIYLGALLLFLGTPLLLGSFYGLLMGLVLIFLLALRTLSEEEMLVHELAGYAEYKKKVKYRLIPFLW